jgi:hypothetical protein
VRNRFNSRTARFVFVLIDIGILQFPLPADPALGPSPAMRRQMQIDNMAAAELPLLRSVIQLSPHVWNFAMPVPDIDRMGIIMQVLSSSWFAE